MSSYIAPFTGKARRCLRVRVPPIHATKVGYLKYMLPYVPTQEGIDSSWVVVQARQKIKQWTEDQAMD